MVDTRFLYVLMWTPSSPGTARACCRVVPGQLWLLSGEGVLTWPLGHNRGLGGGLHTLFAYPVSALVLMAESETGHPSAPCLPVCNSYAGQQAGGGGGGSWFAQSVSLKIFDHQRNHASCLYFPICVCFSCPAFGLTHRGRSHTLASDLGTCLERDML